MKRIILALGALAVLGVVASPASASARCRPALSADMALSQSGVGCNTARGVERYTFTHEALDGSFVCAQRQWLGTIYSRAHRHTYEAFVSPGPRTAKVWITVRYPVSESDESRRNNGQSVSSRTDASRSTRFKP